MVVKSRVDSAWRFQAVHAQRKAVNDPRQTIHKIEMTTERRTLQMSLQNLVAKINISQCAKEKPSHLFVLVGST